jgi:dolichol kinase
LYCIAELLRCRGINVPLVSVITAAAARKRDENRFVLGPVTLALGVICTAILFEHIPASLGIYALAFGDGLASLAGKIAGQVKIPFTRGKTALGSLTCFVAIFCTSFCVLGQALPSLIIACLGMLIELLPLKDLDNFVIPLSIAAVSQYVLHV